jgi:Cu(I)/Ag(I) efflux system membrane protein CusA/SilA
MTVSTVVAGLLPIMWSTRVGAEVMKPLATPVLGGMVSSLIHVLIVTPVIFSWIRERRLGLQHEPLPDIEPTSINWRPAWIGLAVVGVLAAGSWTVWQRFGHGPAAAEQTQAANVVHRMRSGNLDILLVSPTGNLRPGRNAFSIEFHSAEGGALVDVGAVRASANMPMPGMVMPSGMQVNPSGAPGRYDATAEFGMAGAWQMSLEWDGPHGHGSASFEGIVQ